MSEYRMELKERILDAALGEFVEKGIKAVKMDDIATGLSISKRTLYELYANKEDLLLECVKKSHKEKMAKAQRDSACHKNVMDVLIYEIRSKMADIRETNPLFFSDMQSYPKLLEYFRQEKEANSAQFVSFMKRGADEGFFCKNLDYEFLVHFIEEQNNIIMSQQLYKQYSMKVVFFNIMYLSIRGLCTNKGIDIIDKFIADHKNEDWLGTETASF